jgi:hypothetical protein
VIPEDVLPGGCHPYYRHHDLNGLWVAARRHGAVCVAVAPQITAVFTSDGVVPDTAPAIRTLTLTVRRVFGPVPYVGQRRFMLWPALVDEYGRGIGPTDPAQVVEHEDFSEFLNSLPQQPHAVWCTRCAWWHLSTELLTRAGRRRFARHRPHMVP